MKDIEIKCLVRQMQFDELSDSDRKLVEMAREATYRSYAPYSKFCVGAALLLENGEIIVGCNNENAVYPLGLCAERTAIFAAQSQYPNVPLCTIAISARNSHGDFVSTPVPPCGSCRQVMIEQESRYNNNLRLLLDSAHGLIEVKSAKDLMPLSFSVENIME